MASTIRIVSDIAASGTVANALAGNRFEFLPRPSHVAIWAIAHADGTPLIVTGLASNTITATISFGNVVIADSIAVPPSQVGIERAQHQMAAGVADGGDRLIISLANAVAVAFDVVLMLEITDL